MGITFSARKYNQEEWQIVIVGVTSDEKNRIKHFIEDVFGGCDDSEEHFSLMKPREREDE